jgi:hypothetical protein
VRFGSLPPPPNSTAKHLITRRPSRAASKTRNGESSDPCVPQAKFGGEPSGSRAAHAARPDLLPRDVRERRAKQVGRFLGTGLDVARFLAEASAVGGERVVTVSPVAL